MTITRSPRLLLCAAGLLALYAFDLSLLRSELFRDAPGAVSTGIALDLTLTAALLVYFGAIRPGLLPGFALVPVVAGGLLVAGWALPADHQQAVHVLAAGWAAIEVGVIAYLAVKLRDVVRAVGERRGRGYSLPAAIEDSLAERLPGRALAAFAAQDASALYYAVAGWRRADRTNPLRERNLSQWGAVVGLLVFLTVVEAAAVHIMVRGWSGTAAIAISALHAYTILWLLGDLHCVRHNPPALADGTLRVALGFRTRIDVPIDRIARVAVHDGAAPTDYDYVGATLMGEPNLLVELREPVTAHLLFGRTRACTTVGLAVAEPDRARDELLARLDDVPG